MLNRKELGFERRSILTAAQLRAIEKFPREFLRLKFLEYGTGIISGLNYVERCGEIFLTEGLVKIGDEIFFATETNLSRLMAGTIEGKSYSFTLGEVSRTVTENVINETISIDVKEFQDGNKELTFGTFKAGQVKLPALDAENLFKEFTRTSRLNLLNVSYACFGGATFHPYIFRAILQRLERKENPSTADLALMFRLAESTAIPLPVLKLFVESKEIEWRATSREDIFKSVVEAVDANLEIIAPQKVPVPKEKSNQKAQNPGTIFIDDD